MVLLQIHILQNLHINISVSQYCTIADPYILIPQYQYISISILYYCRSQLQPGSGPFWSLLRLTQVLLQTIYIVNRKFYNVKNFQTIFLKTQLTRADDFISTAPLLWLRRLLLPVENLALPCGAQVATNNNNNNKSNSNNNNIEQKDSHSKI